MEGHRAWIALNLEHLRHNVAALQALLPPGCRLMPVVKANAYGHGAVPVARKLEQLGADYLAVACLDEAMELREAGIHAPILILGNTPPEFTRQLLEGNITQTVYDPAQARDFSNRAQQLGRRLRCHLKVDTGMTRIGVRGDGALNALLDALEAWLQGGEEQQ